MTEKKHNPLLFDLFPELQEKISWISLGSFSTPVHRLENLGHPNLWIKRDDKSSSVYGGNKVRKLEFILGDVLKKNKKRVITIGGIGTNHGLATAIYCRQLGLSCSLSLFYQPVTRYVKQNLLLFHYYGAELNYKKDMLLCGIDFYFTQRIKHPNAYFLYAGGSSPLGTLGYVNAAFELKEQIRQGIIPEPTYIICPLGSCGTMAGICLGIILSGLTSTVIGVRVAMSNMGPIEITTPNAVEALIQNTYTLLRKHSKKIPEIQIKTPCVLDNYFGKGYGHPTEEGMSALKLLKEKEDISLDPTYTAKTFVAVLDLMKDRKDSSEPTLYWHTYNSVDLSQKAVATDYHKLPQKFHRLFEEKEPEKI